VVKRPGKETDNSLLLSSGFQNVWSYTSSLSYVFMGLCLIKHRGIFVFTEEIKFFRRYNVINVRFI